MKFENIKVGDTVFTEKCIRYGWQKAETFMIPEKVTKVTKTQFTVESGDRYQKKGYKIGDTWARAYKEGDDRGLYGRKIPVCDETKQMEEFELKLKAEREFNLIAEKLKVDLNSNFNLDEIEGVLKKIEEVSNYIKAKKDENK